MTHDQFGHNPAREALRTQNQLEALRSALAGTNSDLLAVLEVLPDSPQSRRAIVAIRRRIANLEKLRQASLQ